jgi:hypothetical protein
VALLRRDLLDALAELDEELKILYAPGTGEHYGPRRIDAKVSQTIEALQDNRYSPPSSRFDERTGRK